jgi:hypothetical protein
MTYGGTSDPLKQTQTCTADIDTSRLTGFADDYRLVLLCGIMDASIDYLDDTRIAVSAPFHISTNSNGPGIMGIVAPLGKLAEVAKTAGSPPPGLTAPPGQSFSVTFQMWHAIAIIPNDVQSSSINKASDVKQLGGRIITEGVNGSPMQIPMPTSSQPAPKLTQN